MYQELIDRLGELGFGIKEDEAKKVPKYDQYTGELLPEKPKKIKLVNGTCNITLEDDDYYYVQEYMHYFHSKYSKASGYMTICNPSNYQIEDIYEMAKQMLDKLMEYNNETV